MKAERLALAAQARTERVTVRRQQEQQLRELELAAEMKSVELTFAHRTARQQRLGAWLKTKAEPPIMWRPVQESAETEPARQVRRLCWWRL